VLAGATSRLEAAEELASGVPTGEATTLFITTDELLSACKDTEDKEVVGMLAGVTFNLDTDEDGVASGVIRGEATALSIPAAMLLDHACGLYVEKMLVAEIANAVGVVSDVSIGEITALGIPADMLLDCHC
jgi:hypothetical protein